MAGINKVILIGHIGRDPELKYTGSGKAVCTLSVATSRTYRDDKGDRVDTVEWHRVVVWGQQAETCAEFLAKGRQVYVEGRIHARSYMDGDGVERKVFEIVADTVQFLGSATAKATAPETAKATPSDKRAENVAGEG